MVTSSMLPAKAASAAKAMSVAAPAAVKVTSIVPLAAKRNVGEDDVEAVEESDVSEEEVDAGVLMLSGR